MTVVTRQRLLVTAALCAAFLCASAYAVFGDRFASAFSQGSDSTAQSSVLDSSLDRLSTAHSSRERQQAARFIGEQAPSVNSSMVQALGVALSQDPDPSVRAQVAKSFAGLAPRAGAQTPTGRPQAAQMIETLSHAYDKESVSSVRRCIIEAAGEFNDPEAGALISKGLVDTDPAVRESALEARLKRERRLTAQVSG